MPQVTLFRGYDSKSGSNGSTRCIFRDPEKQTCRLEVVHEARGGSSRTRVNL